MTTIAEQILQNVTELPVEMQVETLDFVAFLKEKQAKGKAPKVVTKPNGAAIAELLESASKCHLFEGINDPAEWQREIRKDRPLPGREG